jgi:hypothetical protein
MTGLHALIQIHQKKKNMIKIKAFAVIAAIFVMAWWFRYDTICGQYCVAHDRFTGKWIIPIEEVDK